jgi:hypothetical protein
LDAAPAAHSHLRRDVGAEGRVIGIDVTIDMLQVAHDKSRHEVASLVLADATSIPLAPFTVDALFAAGLVTHVPSAPELFRSLAKSTTSDCRLALFHPVGRATLARRHQRTLGGDELLDPSVLPRVLTSTGWIVESIDDDKHRYLALARIAR